MVKTRADWIKYFRDMYGCEDPETCPWHKGKLPK